MSCKDVIVMFLEGKKRTLRHHIGDIFRNFTQGYRNLLGIRTQRRFSPDQNSNLSKKALPAWHC